MPPSRKAFFSHLQPQLSPVFHPNLLPMSSRFAYLIFDVSCHCLSFVCAQAKPSASMLLAATKNALRFLPFRGVSDAVFGLYLLYWFRCFERMMGPRKCVPMQTEVSLSPLCLHSQTPNALLSYPNVILSSLTLSVQILFFSCSFCLAIWQLTERCLCTFRRQVV